MLKRKALNHYVFVAPLLPEGYSDDDGEVKTSSGIIVKREHTKERNVAKFEGVVVGLGKHCNCDIKKGDIIDYSQFSTTKGIGGHEFVILHDDGPMVKDNRSFDERKKEFPKHVEFLSKELGTDEFIVTPKKDMKKNGK